MSNLKTVYKTSMTPEQRFAYNAYMRKWNAEHRQQIRDRQNAKPKTVETRRNNRIRGEKWRAAHPGGQRPHWLKHEYSITQIQFDEMLIKQENLCLVCLEPFTEKDIPCVDHDHETDENRGLLHRTCNVALGLLGDDPVILDRAATYLRAAKNK